jgi:hypothetical protein
MNTLSFDDGIIQLAVNGGKRIFRFNPTDPAVYEGFMRMVTDAPQKLNKLSIEYEYLDKQELDPQERAMKELEAMNKIDKILREAFDNTFGEGQADVVYGAQNVAALCSNGEYLFINALMAIFPYFEKEGKKRSQKVRGIIQDHKPKQK